MPTPTLTDPFRNKLLDAQFRGQSLVIGAQTQSWGAAPTLYFGLLNVSLWSPGLILSGATWVIGVNGGTTRLFKATTGTAGSTAPTWPTTQGGTVVDGTITWTEQSAVQRTAVQANLPPEFTGGTYARQSQVASLANFSGTQGAGTTTASSGTSGQISNNNSIVFNGGTGGNGGMFAIYDALTGGNMLICQPLTSAPVPMASGSTETFAAGALVISLDN